MSSERVVTLSESAHNVVPLLGRFARKSLPPLPAPDTRRWVTRRKAEVVAAVREGRLSFNEACERYRLSEEEFKSWMALFEAHGIPGLRATRSQEYRHIPAADREGSTSAWQGKRR